MTEKRLSQEHPITTEIKLLLSRLLTRTGDQAWDFVVPFALLHVFPGKLQAAAFYYLVIKLGTLLLTSASGKWMDTTARKNVVRVGIGFQFIGVLFGIIFFLILDSVVHQSTEAAWQISLYFAGLCAAGIFASLGSHITDLAIGNDLVPALVPTTKLTWFNAWMRRIDLSTEVGAPILAGFIYVLNPTSWHHLLGLIVVALWNLISFVPEYGILRGILKVTPERSARAVTQEWKSLFKIDHRVATRSPLFWLLVSNTFLWFSVLSPHGVLLTAYLKEQVQMVESEISLFRALGALFGLISTLSFPFLVRRWGLLRSTFSHILLQGLSLCAGVLAFATHTKWGYVLFLASILVSRIGLYGFNNGEFEIRQRMVPEQIRGELNSLAVLMATTANLFIFLISSLIQESADFQYLVYISAFSVLCGSFAYLYWIRREPQTVQAIVSEG